MTNYTLKMRLDKASREYVIEKINASTGQVVVHETQFFSRKHDADKVMNACGNGSGGLNL